MEWRGDYRITMNIQKQIKFYGATWCPDCRRAKQFLDEQQVTYEYINIDEVEGAAEEVVRINEGYQSIPTMLFPNGIILVEPSNEELKHALEENKDLLISHKGKE